jgi:hypothetical protein
MPLGAAELSRARRNEATAWLFSQAAFKRGMHGALNRQVFEGLLSGKPREIVLNGSLAR